MKKNLFIFIALCTSLFVFGCSSNQKATDTAAKTVDSLLKPINQVSARYGEPSPKIVKTNKDVTDGTVHQAMYAVFLKGNFKKGNLTAHNLEFSILADGSKAWAIRAFDDDNKDTWLDNE
jgi:outer membrane lipoprotein-sorting protein